MLTALERKPLDRLPDEWWELALSECLPFWSWERDAQIAFVSMSKESRNWGEKPTPAIIADCRHNDEQWIKAFEAYSDFRNFHFELTNFRGSWVYSPEGRHDQHYQFRFRWYRVGEKMERAITSRNRLLEFWRDYEAMVSNESGVSVPDTNTTYVEEMVQAFNEAKDVFRRMQAFSRRWPRVSYVRHNHHRRHSLRRRPPHHYRPPLHLSSSRASRRISRHGVDSVSAKYFLTAPI